MKQKQGKRFAKRQAKFVGDCVGWPQADLDRLMRIVENERKITWDTFIQHVPVSELYGFDCYQWPGNPGFGFCMKDDWAVSFHRSIVDGRWYYYVDHGGIEHVWEDSRE